MMKIRVHDKRNGGEIQPIVNISSHKLTFGTEHDHRSALQLFHLLIDFYYFSMNVSADAKQRRITNNLPDGLPEISHHGPV